MIDIPTIETERLLMRAPTLEDFDSYADFLTSARSQMVGGPLDRGPAWHKFCALIGHWHLRGFGRWALEVKSTSECVGIVGLYLPEDWPEPEIAWTLFAKGEGQGYAQEAAKTARNYAYETLGWKRIVSLIDDANTRSIALAKRMGAIRDGAHHHPQFGALTIWKHLAPEAVA